MEVTIKIQLTIKNGKFMHWGPGLDVAFKVLSDNEPRGCVTASSERVPPLLRIHSPFCFKF